MQRISSLAVLLAFAACTTAPQAGRIDVGGLIDRYDADAIESVARELGLSVVSKAGPEEDGGPNIRVRSAKAGEFGVFGASCSGEGAAHRCDGVQFVASFDAPEGAEADIYLEEVNATFSVVKMVRLEDRFTVSRYLIMDSGVSRGNLLVNLQVFEEVLGYVIEGRPG